MSRGDFYAARNVLAVPVGRIKVNLLTTKDGKCSDWAENEAQVFHNILITYGILLSSTIKKLVNKMCF